MRDSISPVSHVIGVFPCQDPIAVNWGKSIFLKCWGNIE